MKMRVFWSTSWAGTTGLDHILDQVLLQLVHLHVLVVLGGDDNGVHPLDRVPVVLHGDLGLAVGAQVFQGAIFAHSGQLFGQLVGQGDGQRHQLGGFVAGIAEHHALVPGAGERVLVGFPVFGLQGLVDAHGDIGGLSIDGGEHAAGVAVKAALGVVVTDLLHHLADDGGDVHIAGGGDLPHHMDHTGGGGGLAGHMGLGVLF